MTLLLRSWIWLNRLWNGSKGQSVTEYAMVLALVVIVVIAILTTMGDTVKAVFTKISDSLQAILSNN